jgi:hypothetical protein
MTSAIPEPRLAKSDIPTAALREQASTGLYFEYTYAMGGLDNGSGEVMYRNVALFAAHKSLLLKHSTVKVVLPATAPAIIQPSTVQKQFRADDKSKLGRELTVEEAFLTVIHAWMFATLRPQVGRIELETPQFTDPEYVTVGAHCLVNEPLLVPISTKDTIALHGGDKNTLRKIGRQAEALWTAHETEPRHSDNLNTPAHRIPNVETNEELDAESLIGKIAVSLLEQDPTAYTEYVPLDSDRAPATAKLPALLKATATGDHDWA